MAIELRILGGARTGHTESFEKSVIAIGRHPLSDLRFDAKRDLDVSSRHGEIRLVDGRYAIYDAQSTNGTFVNGTRVAPGGLRELHDNDVITFGPEGPSVAVRVGRSVTPPRPRPGIIRTPPEALPVEMLEVTSPAHPVSNEPPTPAKRRPSTGERVAVAVAQQTRNLRVAIVAVVLVLGGLAGAVFYKNSRDTAASRAQIDQLIAENAQVRQELETKLQGDTVLTNSLSRQNDSLMQAVRDARGAQAATAAELLRKHHALQRQFSQMDPATVARDNAQAIAVVSAQVGADTTEATGFVVTSSGLLLTNRHVVVDKAGNRASRIFVKLAKSTGTHRARLVRVLDDSIDLALIQIDGSGPFPAVRGVASSVDVAAGAPTMTLGYPYGTDLPMQGSVVEPTVTMGVVGRSIADLLQIDSFASYGASGSPVFDTHGHVIGVVWGGPKDAGGRIVFAVPAERIAEIMKGGK